MSQHGRRSAPQSTRFNVIERKLVTEGNLEEIRGVTAVEQHPMLRLGDTVSVIFFHNAALRCTGTVTIWHNRNYAAIKTYSTSMSGEWLEPLKLIVSHHQEEGWTLEGELVTGCLAMDIDGVRGVYSCGEFYRDRDSVLAG